MIRTSVIGAAVGSFACDGGIVIAKVVLGDRSWSRHRIGQVGAEVTWDKGDKLAML